LTDRLIRVPLSEVVADLWRVSCSVVTSRYLASIRSIAWAPRLPRPAAIFKRTSQWLYCSHSNSNLLTIPIAQIVIRSSGFSTNRIILLGYSSVVCKSHWIDTVIWMLCEASVCSTRFSSTMSIRRANLVYRMLHYFSTSIYHRQKKALDFSSAFPAEFRLEM